LAVYLVLKSLNPKPGWINRSYDTDNLIQTLQQLDYRAEVNMSAEEREGGNFQKALPLFLLAMPQALQLARLRYTPPHSQDLHL
jgi:hypothetical protein